MNWLLIKSYEKVRRDLLLQSKTRLVARVGSAVEAKASWDVLRALAIVSDGPSDPNDIVCGIDAPSGHESTRAKELRLQCVKTTCVRSLMEAPDHRFVFEHQAGSKTLGQFASSYQGLATADYPRFGRCFWERPMPDENWEYQQSTVTTTNLYAGKEQIVHWEGGQGELARSRKARVQGLGALRRQGVAVTQTRILQSTLYTGTLFDNNVAALVVHNPDELAAVWCYCSSPDFVAAVRKFDEKLGVTNSTFLKVDFDLDHWQMIAAKEYPRGLPDPESEDPTQWLFHGWPEQSTSPLQVTVARLLAYQWPAELDTEMRLSRRSRQLAQHCKELLRFAEDDGIVCIPAVRTELPAAERLLELLQATYGEKWSNLLVHDLLTETGCKPGTTLEDWLRNVFFEQHCKLFHHRPFVWQIWDGRKDGFSCLVNYHKLNYKTLDNLTHSYVETWIKKQAGDAKTGKAGADLRIAAAQALQEKLKLILAGEPPYDIFVRWKPLHEQPIGWNPDLNDGVRVNIRPFVEAGILRKSPNVNWTKDRGTEPERDKDDYPWFWKDEEFVGDRVNDIHLTNAEKQTARKQ
jgi:hypothetical protein